VLLPRHFAAWVSHSGVELEESMSTTAKISRALDKIVHLRLKNSACSEPPRLVRANSAFDMLFSFMKN